ncbi:citrate/2-methylcitrate synthase [Paraliomyxa miuraensis]|uniref:citrate/2-methylcitrate synthase n=1 Tax=Paraliomyxa miuraensis TaxID=376150 RepID=UPI00224D9C34|nr:citrate/2-methylcitrate synthase [Paraliomyxa miuraensis]MCX4240900.1 citrate synthase/methylcitrate synthase [Paraliomyxa miuraensis]
MDALARGLEGVVLTESRISMVDGQAGRLVIAGFPVETLAPQATFEEMLLLLWNDRLPTRAELVEARVQLVEAGRLAPETIDVLRAAARRELLPMDALRMGLATLGLDDHEVNAVELQASDARKNQRRALAVVGAVPAIIGAYHRLRAGLEPIPPDPALGHAANYLAMLFGEEPSAARVRALDTYLNATVDHGMNASTFTARVIASTRSDVASAVLGALGALKGPLHGGAPGPALEMVYELQARARQTGQPLSVLTEDHVRRVVGGGGRIMGFGHRVYRVRDPRADVLGVALERLFPNRGDNPLYDDARTVERVVLRVLGELKPHRPLATNVELYTALLLQSLELPVPLFTPTFAVARVGGWTAHVLEQAREDRLIRPRAIYVGPIERQWVPSEERGVGMP